MKVVVLLCRAESLAWVSFLFWQWSLLLIAWGLDSWSELRLVAGHLNVRVPCEVGW